MGSPGTAPQLPPEPRHTRVVWTLGLGAFGLAFSLTTTAAYLPPLLARRRRDRRALARLGDTRGYQALWPILGVPVLLAIPLVARLSAAERNAGPGKPESPEPIV